jgi:hypothetical protein
MPRRAELFKSSIEIDGRDPVELWRWDDTGKEVLILGSGVSRRRDGLIPE